MSVRTEVTGVKELYQRELAASFWLKKIGNDETDLTEMRTVNTIQQICLINKSGVPKDTQKRHQRRDQRRQSSQRLTDQLDKLVQNQVLHHENNSTFHWTV